MLATMSAEPHDYEVMFKRHVHDNLMLNNDLRLMDDMKKAKLKELSRDRDLFKAKFSKFNRVKSNRHVPERHFTRNATPKASHKPSFIVCKSSPCSLKTWSNLTDLTKEKVDVYRTDVLQSEEETVSFRKNKNSDSNPEKCSQPRKINSALAQNSRVSELQLSRSQTMLSKSIGVSDRTSEPEADDCHLPDFRQRSSTMPSYCYQTKNNLVNKVLSLKSSNKQQSEVKEIKDITASSRDNEVVKNIVQTNENELTQPIPSVTVSDHSNEASSKATDKELKVTFDLSDRKSDLENVENGTTFPKIDNKFQRANSMIAIGSDSPETFRKRRMTLPGNMVNKSPSPQIFRRRSMTIDSTRGKLLDRRTSIDTFNMATRRQSLFDKLLTASISSSEDVSDTDMSKSLENIETCRYLRKPGQSIQGSVEELNLENVLFLTQDSDSS